MMARIGIYVVVYSQKLDCDIHATVYDMQVPFTTPGQRSSVVDHCLQIPLTLETPTLVSIHHPQHETEKLTSVSVVFDVS